MQNVRIELHTGDLNQSAPLPEEFPLKINLIICEGDGWCEGDRVHCSITRDVYRVDDATDIRLRSRDEIMTLLKDCLRALEVWL